MTGDVRLFKLLCDIVSFRVEFSVIVRQTDIWNMHCLSFTFTFKTGQDLCKNHSEFQNFVGDCH